MLNSILQRSILPFVLIISVTAGAQQLRAFNQNASRSNHTRLSFTLSPAYSSPIDNKKDSLLFRGTGAGFRIGGDYFLGKAGIGFQSGFGSSTSDNAAINNFLKNGSIPSDQLIISRANQQNMYLLLGPSVRFGNQVQFYAHAKGGLFINNGGLVSIEQRGASKVIYRNESTGRTIYPGLLAGLNVEYSIKPDTWSLGFGLDYLGTKTEVTNYDARRNGGTEGIKLVQPIRDLVAGITLRYTILSPRDHASGQATGKRDAASGMATGRRVLPTVNKREIATSREAGSGLATGRRDAASGMATGKRVLPTVNKREIAIDESGVHLNSDQSCGPVTMKTTKPDGTSEEMTFSCPADAEAFTRQATAKDQKQWSPANFRTVSNAAGSKGVISGIVQWGSSSSPANAIITNNTTRGGSVTMNSQTSSTRQTSQGSFGTSMILTARDAGSGMATGKRSREAGSGLATGRRQHEPVYIENGSAVCNPCTVSVSLSSINNNPMYKGKGNPGDNPLFEGAAKSATDDCAGIPGLDVLLVEAATGHILSATKTEACGDFWFAHVPDADYIIRIQGKAIVEKIYDLSITGDRSYDLEGSILFPMDWIGTVISNSDTVIPQQKAGISTSRSNIPRSRSSFINADTDGDGSPDELLNPHTGIYSSSISIGDLDGDGIADIVSGNLYEGGAALEPGDPIPGLDVKLKNGAATSSISTDEEGHFIIEKLSAGQYQLLILNEVSISDELFLATGATTRVQDHNSSRSNKTASSISQQGGNSSNNNTTRNNVGPVKWMAPESMKRSVASTHNHLGNVSASLDELERQLDNDQSTPKATVNTSRSNIKNQRVAISNLEQAMDGMEYADKEVAVAELDQKIRDWNSSFLELQASLSRMGSQYTSISNVLKTRHETAMNAIRNMK